MDRTIIWRANPATVLIGQGGAELRQFRNAFDAKTRLLSPQTHNAFDPASRLLPQSYLLDRTSAFSPRPIDIAALSPEPLPEGTLLIDRYEVIKLIGRGGFAYVYLCRHYRNGQLYAVKEAFGPTCSRSGTNVVPHDEAEFGSIRAALMREASAISRVRHPGTVSLEEIFEANDTLYFVMDFVEGESLSSLLARREISQDTFTDIARSLLDALEAVHDSDVLHGDIKPGNIIVRPDKSVVLIDFGLAARLTDLKHLVIGVAPGYSAPERYIRNGAVGAWSDVYSCAATLASALAGKPASDWSSGDGSELDTAGLLRAARDRLDGPHRWFDALERGLRLEPADRIVSVAELRDAMGFAPRAAESETVSPAGPSAFISYAHADANTVEPLVLAIQRRGTGVWIDREGIVPGSPEWAGKIVRGMRGAGIVLLFSSANSMSSDYVKDEIYLARELKKQIIVTRLDQTPFNDGVILFLVKLQHINAFEMDRDAVANAIISAIAEQ